MLRRIMMAGLVLAAASSAGCGKGESNVTPDAGLGGAGAAGACLDSPLDLPRPPTGALPCELLPPGFVTKAD